MGYEMQLDAKMSPIHITVCVIGCLLIFVNLLQSVVFVIALIDSICPPILLPERQHEKTSRFASPLLTILLLASPVYATMRPVR